MPAVPVEVFQFFSELAASGYTGDTLLHWTDGTITAYDFTQKVRVGKQKPVIRIIAQ